MNYFELIDAYLANSLSELDRLSFEKELIRNHQLRNEVQITQEMASFAPLDTMVSKQMERMRSQTQGPFHHKVPQKPRIQPMRSIRRLATYAASAIFVLLLTGITFSTIQKSKMNHLLTPPNFAQEKGKPDSKESISSLFNTKQFDKAAILLQQKVKVNPTNYHDLLYLGISYCFSENPALAHQSFDKIINDKKAINEDAALYWKAVCFVENGESDKAELLLLELTKNHTGRIVEKGKKLLKLL